MTSYVDSNLMPGERVIYRGAVHWIIYLAPVVMLGFGIAWTGTGGTAGPIVAGLGALAGLAAWIRQTSSEFAVTSNRVIVKTGFVSRKTIEINLSRIESVQVEQDLFGRMLNYGTMVVVGTGGTKEPFSPIDNPAGFRHAVQSEQR
ncbi:MAG: PH domain-containing protein [Rhizomicrobium sp.]